MDVTSCSANDHKRSSKYRIIDFLPSLKPSLVTLILTFFCAYLWMKTTAANDRLFMMEKQMTVLSKESRAGKNAFEPTRLFQSGKNSELNSRRVEVHDKNCVKVDSFKVF